MAQPSPTPKPDERALRAALAGGAFQLGVHEGRWRVGDITWPFVDIAVRAADRDNAPSEYWLRFDCTDYPNTAPTARPWNTAENKPLSPNCWPNGKTRVPAVFRPDWKDGVCLYLPCDRIAAEGHANWRTDHPALQWSPTRGIVLYLDEVYALLNSSDYTGTRGGGAC